MTIYQEELLRRLPMLNCTGAYHVQDELLHVFQGHFPLCCQEPNGFLRFDRDQIEAAGLPELYEKIQEEADIIREYVGLYEAAPQMNISGVKEFRSLSEYGKIVLAAKYNETHGFTFTTWEQNRQNDRVDAGDYTSDYRHAKESFICRSGLISKERLFSLQEAENLYRCVDYARNHCGSLTFEQSKALDELAEKLSFGYPEIENNPPTFEPEDGPQLNL